MACWTFLQELAALAQHEVSVQGLGTKDLHALLDEVANHQPSPVQWSEVVNGSRFVYHDLLETFFHIYLHPGDVKERIYINCRADHILAVFGFVRNHILTLRGTVGGKCCGPLALERADNIVIYLADEAASRVALPLLLTYAEQHPTYFCDTVPLTTKQIKTGLGIATGAEPPAVDPFINAEDRINKLVARYEVIYASRLPADPVARRQMLLRVIEQKHLKADVFKEQASFGGFRAALIKGCLDSCLRGGDFSAFCHEVEAQFKVVGIDPRHPELQSDQTRTAMMHRGGAVSQNKRAGVK